MNKKHKYFKERYNNFLKEKIKEYCNDNGCYEIYWDYRDSLEPKTLLEAYNNYKKSGFEMIEDYLVDKLMEWNIDYDNELVSTIRNDLKESDFYSQDFGIWFEENCDIYEDIQDSGYNGIDINLKGLLNNSEFCFNIMFATDEEQNSDMTNLIRAYGTYYQPDFEKLENDDFDNALTYLIHQQGHTCKEYFEILNEKPYGIEIKDKCNFIESVVDDIVNNSSDFMSELTILVKMTGQAAIDFLNYKDNLLDNRNMVFDKNCDIGIFNEWSGCGGLLEIVLDRDFIVPKSLIRDFQIEGAKNSGYTVDEVYGLIGECWKECIGYTNEQPKLIEENLEEIIMYARYNNIEMEKEM